MLPLVGTTEPWLHGWAGILTGMLACPGATGEHITARQGAPAWRALHYTDQAHGLCARIRPPGSPYSSLQVSDPDSIIGEGSLYVEAQELLRRYQAGKRDFVLLSLRASDLRGADLYHANLSGSDLREADLSEANLVGARLRRVDLGGADLRGAKLSGADLGAADLQEADLRGADLSYANLERTRVSPEQLAQVASLEGAILPDGTVGE
jgi:hypothetical protein